ncbi:thioredoxin-dependent thiol peroxidase [Niabella ginsengisoli]|uniref:thioredoxin-dependent peroxiredoxin n=1 Tax=Niabella ginsengisoli TaxID=522298 RepID=A0ABS9SMR0_9BACT|nr:thioredoxin-dependent thiol peroxidase [Niabella ginsengisoli]MCH5599670.1 thioredoxin-dependent thiol peroxidase [Niabella ginsengisoli]
MPTHLKEGQKAPAFSGKDQDGNKISLSQFKGRKIALYFYPQDLTPTCTVQACNLRDNFSLLQKNGIQIIGISPDDMAKHKRFIERNALPFPLIADTNHKILEKYGVWGEKQMFGHKYMGVYRTTFLIDEKGAIKKIFLKPKSKQHAEEIIEGF